MSWWSASFQRNMKHNSWELHIPSQQFILSTNTCIFPHLFEYEFAWNLLYFPSMYHESDDSKNLDSSILDNMWETRLETSEPFSFWSAVTSASSDFGGFVGFIQTYVSTIKNSWWFLVSFTLWMLIQGKNNNSSKKVSVNYKGITFDFMPYSHQNGDFKYT